MFTHRPSRIPLAPEALGSRGSANPHSKPPACRLGSRGSEKELAQGRTAHRGRAGVGHGLAACRRGLALCLLGAESRAVDLPGTEDAVGSWPAGPQALSIAPRECRSALATDTHSPVPSAKSHASLQARSSLLLLSCPNSYPAPSTWESSPTTPLPALPQSPLGPSHTHVHTHTRTLTRAHTHTHPFSDTNGLLYLNTEQLSAVPGASG